jgi:VWFA-related protein
MYWLYRAGFAFIVSLPACLLAQQGAVPAEQAPAAQEPALAERPAPLPNHAVGRIRLDVVVTDKSGKPVSGLEREDFTLLDDKQPAKILSFHAYNPTTPPKDLPPEIILMFDTVNIGDRYVVTVRQAIEKFLRQNDGHLAQPVAVLLMTNLGVTLAAQPSLDGNALATTVEQLQPRLRTIGPAQGAWGDLDRFQFSTKSLDSIVEPAAHVAGKKLLVWLGPGWPMLDGPGFEFSPHAKEANFDAIVRFSTLIREARMSLYSVTEGTGDIHSTDYQSYVKGAKQAKQADPAYLSLRVMAAQSGGHVLGPDNDLVAQINHSVADATAFYTISFDPPRADRPNEYHDLKVQIGKPGLTARTNTGYYNQPQ